MKKTVFRVMTTTENGADYMVKSCKSRPEAEKWEHDNRDNSPRPMWVDKFTY